MTQTGGESAAYFSSVQQEYDSLIRRAVPPYEEMLDALMAYVPATATDILELGAGSGNLTLRVLERYPAANVTSMDVSQDMLDLAGSRVGTQEGDRAGRWVPVCNSFESLPLEGQEFDLVVSSISLHHVQDKLSLFEAIKNNLRTGGELWLVDQMWGATKRTADFNWEHWLAFCRLPEHCSEEELRGLVEHAEAHDHYESVNSYMRALEQTGFDSATIDCVWRSTMWGVVGASV
jgi:tRNA (cmo5U34)-methyltransferase